MLDIVKWGEKSNKIIKTIRLFFTENGNIKRIRIKYLILFSVTGICQLFQKNKYIAYEIIKHYILSLCSICISILPEIALIWGGNYCSLLL